MKKIVFTIFLMVSYLAAFAQVPIITDFTPTSGPVGTTVTITGTNFSANPTENIVYFGAVKAPVVSASTTSLTATAPAGATYQAITVTTNGLTGYSNKPFVISGNNNSGVLSNSSTTKIDFATGNHPVKVTIGDLDGDGKSDLAVANLFSNSISILRNTGTKGTTSFAAKIDYPTQNSPTGVALGDFNGDGKLDLAVANFSESVSIFTNNSNTGTISFAPKIDYPASAAESVAISDLDGDGKPDLAVFGGSTVSVFKNTSANGVVSFTTPIEYSAGASGGDVALGDLDGDARPDLVVTSNTSISVLRNTSTNGTIAFAPKIDHEIGGNSAIEIVVGDFDGDERSDLAVANYDANTLSVLKNTSSIGTIAFAPYQTYFTVSKPASVAASDLDGDGKVELVVANGGTNTLTVFKNISFTGTVSFEPKVNYPTGTDPLNVAIGDLDDDGKSDLAVTNQSANTISVLKIQMSAVHPSVPPTISSFTPVSGPVGTTVTITGANFSANPSDNIVYFGAAQATVVSATTSSLKVTVPAGATYYPITVTTYYSTAYTNKPFVLTFPDNCQTFHSNSFAPLVSYLLTEKPSDVATGDFDGDGKPDLVETNSNAQVLTVFRNTDVNGNVAFEKALTVPTGTFRDAARIAVSDLDRDGKLDIAVVFGSENRISVFRNTSSAGQISFDGPKDYPTGNLASGIAIGDLDGDGRPDIAVSFYGESTNSVSLFRNTGGPGTIDFASRTDISGGSGATSIAIGDLNNDGKPDLVVGSSFFNDKVSTLKNISSIGSISYAPGIEYKLSKPVAVAIGDLDRDGKADITVADANLFHPAITVLRNIGFGDEIAFAGKVDYPIANGATQVMINDLNGDGKPDIAVTDERSNAIFILQNKSGAGTISLGDAIGFVTGSGPKGLAIADFTQDGKPDLATANGQNFPGTLSVFKNIIAIASCTPPVLAPPVITSFTPNKGPAGSAVTVTGINFDPVPSNNVVYFGAVKAPVTSATPTTLTVTVPSGATYQPISVTRGQLTGHSSQPFTLTFPNNGPDGFVANSFSHAYSLPVSRPIGHPVLSDLDGDGKPDLSVLGSVDERKISIFRNTSINSSISFGDKKEITSDLEINDFAIHDIDGDGKPDLAYIVQSFDSSRVYILKNKSTPNLISFAEPVKYGSGAFAHRISFHDVDNDGKPDILLDNYSILKNKSSGSKIDFDARVIFPKLAGAQGGFEIVDVDGDGKEDVIAVNNNKLSVFQNNSNNGVISFEPAGQSNYYFVSFLTLGDLDGDEKPDLIGANFDAKEIYLTRNTSSPGAISFAETVIYKLDFNPLEISVGDLDGDGKPDLAAANYSGKVAVFNNISTIGQLALDKRVEYVTGENNGTPFTHNGVSIGDLDGDGKPDLAAAFFSSGTVSILRNQIGEIPCIPPTFLNNLQIVLDASECGNDGNISIIPLTGTAPFMYSIDGGATYVAGGNAGHTFQELAAGTYQLRLKDANGCESAVVTREIKTVYPCNNAPCTPPTFLNNNQIVLDASCNGGDGAIYIIPTSGTAPFMYSIDGGATYVSGPNAGYAFQNLSAGSYQLRLKDAKGCESAVVTREVKANAFGPCATIQALSPRLRPVATEAATIRAYPNPSRGQFQVQLQRFASPKLQVQVLDSRGVVVQSRQVNAQETSTLDINLTGKAKGLYLIRVVSDKGTQQTKVLIQ